MAFLAAFDPGDRVAVTVPGYPCYRNALRALGVEVVPLMTTLADNFQPTVAMLASVGPIDGLVITSPSNPTGTMIDSETLGALMSWCTANEVVVISDEIYHGLTYMEAASSALEHNPDAIVVNSFSKYFSMTGWRLGWLVLPSPLVSPVLRFAANLLLAPSSLSQHGAIAAFDCHDELQSHLVRYAANRALLLEGLQEAGFGRLAPAEGAFYVYADVSAVTDNSQELCAQWLDELGVAATPGTDFDPVNGTSYVRFSFCGATETIVRGVELLRSWAKHR